MGPTALVLTDCTRQIVYVEVHAPGNLADQTLYQQTPFFTKRVIDDHGYSRPCTPNVSRQL